MDNTANDPLHVQPGQDLAPQPTPQVNLDMPARIQLPGNERRMLQLGKYHYLDPLDISAVYIERSYVVVLLKSGHKLEVGEKQLLISKEETVRAIAAEYVK